MERYESIVRDPAARLGEDFTADELRTLAKHEAMASVPEIRAKLEELAGWIERPISLGFVLRQCADAVREQAWADGDVARFRAADGSEPWPQDAEAFMRDLWALYKRHGLAISHEDGHGAFEIVTADEFHARWLSNASDRRPVSEAIRFQHIAAKDHIRYRAECDDGATVSIPWASLHAKNRANAFLASWWHRFGTHETEAWA